MKRSHPIIALLLSQPVPTRKRKVPVGNTEPAVFPGSRGRRKKLTIVGMGADGCLNPLPARNAVNDDAANAYYTLLVQGEGVQLGMGDDAVEAPRTKLKPLIDGLVKFEQAAMGGEGIVGIAAGETFSLVVDFIGRVRIPFLETRIHIGVVIGAEPDAIVTGVVLRLER